jgi:hypothetical protein
MRADKRIGVERKTRGDSFETEIVTNVAEGRGQEHRVLS